MNLEEYKSTYSSDDGAPGWDAIDTALDALYPNQEPKHYGTAIKHMLGGPDPIDGFSIFTADNHVHLVTYGFSNLYYDEEFVGEDFSKYGFELTMRLSLEEHEPYWAMNMIQNIARYVFESGKWFEAGHYMPANGPIKLESETELVGLAFDIDPELKSIETPHGVVEFLQIFGLTQKELDQIFEVDKNAQKILSKHKEQNPLLITDLNRSEI